MLWTTHRALLDPRIPSKSDHALDRIVAASPAHPIKKKSFIHKGMDRRGVEDVVPVDLHIPGCPRRPTQLLAALLALLETM